MRIVIAIVLGVIVGFVAGLMLSQLIGIIGFLAFGQVVGIKFLSIYTAIVGAIIGPVLATRTQQRAVYHRIHPKRDR
jgi:hypothetical protein